ncbi:MAG TPA: phosphatidate cytidylyltransferase, partial [Alphaproteobacteria bacterium]|nr:phosphatidate cytidylyltransferase [Alphaproteobacteria bacterium]
MPNTDGGTAATAPSPAPAEAPAGRRPSELTLRILSALVLLPIAVGEVWFGGYAFLGFVIVFCLACSYEWAKLTAPGRVALAACIVAVPLVVATVAS